MNQLDRSQDYSNELVEAFRTASRNLVREFGFMNKTIADSDMSPSAVHALIEINHNLKITAKDLSAGLLLEKSTVSRLIKSLIKTNLIIQNRSSEDAREKHFLLTAQGHEKLEKINAFAKNQVMNAIASFNKNQQLEMLNALQHYSNALRVDRVNTTDIEKKSDSLSLDLKIQKGYYPSLLGRIIELHVLFYSELIGFGAVFETVLARELAEFLPRIKNPKNAIWFVKSPSQIMGNIAIDGEKLGSNKALLRWFIVDSSASGLGLGKKLLANAIKHCKDKGFSEIQLWTFSGLDIARKLYEDQGFVLFQECLGDHWGKEVLEQQFIKKLEN